MSTKKVLIICHDENSMTPSYEIIKYLKEAGYVSDICHNNDKETNIKASRLLEKDLGLSEYVGLIVLDDGGDGEAVIELLKKANSQEIVIGCYSLGAILASKANLLKDIPVCSGLPENFYEEAEEVDAPSVRAGNIVTSAGDCAIGFAVLLVDALGGEVKNIVQSANDNIKEEASAIIIGPVSDWPAYWPISREITASNKVLVISDPKDIDIQTSSFSGFVFSKNDILPVKNMKLPNFTWIRDNRISYVDHVQIAEKLESAGYKSFNASKAIKELSPKACNDAILVLSNKIFEYKSNLINIDNNRKNIINIASGHNEITIRKRGNKYIISDTCKNLLIESSKIDELIKNKFGDKNIIIEKDVNRAKLGNKTYAFEWIMIRSDKGWIPCYKYAIANDEIHPAQDIIRIVFPNNPFEMEGQLDEMASVVSMIIQSLITDPEDLREMSIVMITDDDKVVARSVSPITSMKVQSKICNKKIALSLGIETNNIKPNHNHPYLDDPSHIYIVERELAHEGIWFQPNKEIIVDQSNGPRRVRNIQELIVDLKDDAIKALDQENELKNTDNELLLNLAHQKSCKTRHRLRMALEMECLLGEKRKKLAGIYPSSIAGPYANVDVPMYERIFCWQEGDDWLTDKDKAIRNLSRYNPEYQKSNFKESTGFYYIWEEERREPTDWADVITGEDTVYPMRSILKK